MNKERMIYRIQKKLFSGYAKYFLDCDIQVDHPLPDGPKLIVANHPTTTDPFLLSLISDEPVFIPVTGMAFEIPIFGPILHAAGHIPVDKYNLNGQHVISQAVEKLSHGKTIGIFPEGSLSPDVGEFCSTKTGAARIALLSSVPVIPVGIYLNKSSYYEKKMKTENYTAAARFACRGKYAMTVGNPLHFSGGIGDFGYVRFIAEQIMQNIISQAAKSQRRVMLNQTRSPKPVSTYLRRVIRFS